MNNLNQIKSFLPEPHVAVGNRACKKEWYMILRHVVVERNLSVLSSAHL